MRPPPLDLGGAFSFATFRAFAAVAGFFVFSTLELFFCDFDFFLGNLRGGRSDVSESLPLSDEDSESELDPDSEESSSDSPLSSSSSFGGTVESRVSSSSSSDDGKAAAAISSASGDDIGLSHN